ncbi:MAG: M15 family metallopeptidase [Treponema sp.]|nr:M15 family metallopeptidase [Treponema sp.]
MKKGCALVLVLLLCGCTGKKALQGSGAVEAPGSLAGFSGDAPASSAAGGEQRQAQFRRQEVQRLAPTLAAAEIPPETARNIRDNAAAFLAELEKILNNNDPYLRILVDKGHPLPEDYEPEDLIELRYQSYRAGISDVMMLRAKAEAALEEMAGAAKKAGLTLTVSSAYRSYQYQIGSFDRWTKRLGLEEAERVSARPGRSQHQLGLVVDFGSITNEFAETAQGRWVKANASRFGWSLSFPRGYEELTGYAWESWHYRYVGQELCSFIDTWFGGIQQHALRFIHEWEKAP